MKTTAVDMEEPDTPEVGDTSDDVNGTPGDLRRTFAVGETTEGPLMSRT